MTAVDDFIEAQNAADGDAMIAAFAPGALVNDAQRELRGAAAIRRWIDDEIIGANVTMQVERVEDVHGVFVVTAKIDGTYDKTGLPDPLILTYYFTLAAGRIGTLVILHNKDEA